MIDSNGKIQSNVKGYKVDMSGLGKQSTVNPLVVPSSIKITAPDGYIYHFGTHPHDPTDISPLEFTKPFNASQQIDGTNSTIKSWHLSRIEAPNGRSAKFTYYYDADSNSKTSNLWQSYKTDIHTSNIFPTTFSATRTVFLKSIEIEDSGIKVEFEKSVESCQKFYDNFTQYNEANYQLDKIQVKQNGAILYSWDFGYENQKKWRFLSTIKQANAGIYRFTYNHVGGYPSLSDISPTKTDTWGYWSENSLLGVLEKIEYPSGGYSLFSYDKNEYSKRVDVKLSSGQQDYKPTLKDIFGTSGGARIKKITHYTELNKKASEKEYQYLSTNNESSGILLQYPPYFLYNQNQEAVLYQDVYLKSYSVSEPHIGYSRIKEINSDASYTIHYYTDYKNNPDEFELNFLPSSLKADSYKLLLSNVNPASSSSSKRGLLAGVEYYNANNKMLKAEYNEYKNVISDNPVLPTCPNSLPEETGNDKSNYLVSFRAMQGGAMTKKIYLRNNSLLSTQTITDGVAGRTDYKYNNEDLLSMKTITINCNDIQKVIYKYSNDYPATDIRKKLKDKNILNLVVEEKRLKNNDTLSTKVNYYTLLEDRFPVLSYVMDGFGNNPLLKLRLEYSKYDKIGNPISIIKDNNLKYVYLWGYNANYPIAEINNASYAEVMKALEGVKPEDISILPEPDIDLINSLRNKLSNSQVITYEHIPSVGVKSIINVNGMNTFYEYDNIGRLKGIRDNDNNYIEKYQYKYKDGSILPLSLDLSVRAAYKVNTTEKFIVYTNGGSGDFEYDWFLLNDSQQIISSQLAVKSDSYTVDLNTIGKGFIKCIVRDLKVTNSNITIMKSFSIVENLLQADIELPTYDTNEMNEIIYRCNKPCIFKTNTIGGSGIFTYLWTLKDFSGTILQQLNSQIYNVTFNEEKNMILTCTVKDMLSGETKTINKYIRTRIDPVQLSWGRIFGQFNVGYLVDIQLKTEYGSGKFRYDWQFRNKATGTVVFSELNSINPKWGILLNCDFGLYELSCTVKDLEIGYQTVIKKDVSVTLPFGGMN